MLRWILSGIALAAALLVLAPTERTDAHSVCESLVDLAQIQITCAPGDVLKDVRGNGSWQCHPDRGQIVTRDQLQIGACSAGQALCWGGGAWECCDLETAGDFDGDGLLDIVDVTLARRRLAGLAATP